MNDDARYRNDRIALGPAAASSVAQPQAAAAPPPATTGTAPRGFATAARLLNGPAHGAIQGPPAAAGGANADGADAAAAQPDAAQPDAARREPFSDQAKRQAGAASGGDCARPGRSDGSWNPARSDSGRSGAQPARGGGGGGGIFAMASGRTIAFTEESRRKGAAVLEADVADVASPQRKTFRAPKPFRPPAAKQLAARRPAAAQPQASTAAALTGFFATARGRPIAITDAGVQKARAQLGEDFQEILHLPDEDRATPPQQQHKVT